MKKHHYRHLPAISIMANPPWWRHSPALIPIASKKKAPRHHIDLGFAFLQEGDIRFGFVDVPATNRFVGNMLAGAAGIDVVLLVISADESVKPQTREHFDICRLLGIQHGIVALTNPIWSPRNS